MSTQKNTTYYDSLSSAIEAIMGDYPDVMIFDRNRNTSTTVKLKGNILDEDKRSLPRSYSETWNRYIASYVVYEDKNHLLMSVENETIYTKLQKEGLYSHDYGITYKGEPMRMRVTFLEVHADKDYLIFGFKNIT